jgi:NucS shadow ORF
MSLHVSTALLERAEVGAVEDAEFVDCVRESLPYAWEVVSLVAGKLHAGADLFAEDATPPPSEVERGQLLRALASDSIRNALQRHFGVVLAFQNCHRVAAFRPDNLGAPYAAYVSPREQVLNQSPELRNC